MGHVMKDCSLPYSGRLGRKVASAGLFAGTIGHMGVFGKALLGNNDPGLMSSAMDAYTRLQ